MENQPETQLPSAYNPKEVEDRWYQVWEKSGDFTADASSLKPHFTMVIPRPT